MEEPNQLQQPDSRSALRTSDEAIWLMVNLDKSLPADYLDSARVVLERFVQYPDAYAQMPFKFSGSRNEAERIYSGLRTLESEARKKELFTAARIAQAWRSAIRLDYGSLN